MFLRTSHRVALRTAALAVLFTGMVSPLGRTEDLITREYRLKNVDAGPVIQAIKFAIANPTGKRIMGGQGQRLVITDAIDQQNEIAEILPILDQKLKETQPVRMQMELSGRAANYLAQKKKAMAASQRASPGPPTAGAPSSDGSPAGTFDIRRSSMAYKSVYSDEDAKLMKKPRVVHDDPVLPSISSLTLKGIFMANSKSPLALLSYEGKNFTARDGGLFEANKSRVPGVVTQVYKDYVTITGPDRIPHQIRFYSTL